MSGSASVKVTDRLARVHGTIARELGVQIVSGRVQPGCALGGEIESSEKYKVSRTAYREAVRSLAAKGLVMAKPKVGTVVCAVERWHLLDPDVLRWAFEGDNPDEDLLAKLFELRMLIEPEAAALAADRRSVSHVEVMQDALDRMARFTLSSDAGRKADLDFHAAVLQASANPFLISLTDGINAAIDATTELKVRACPLGDPMPAHGAVFKAIADGIPAQARQRMAKLVRQAQLETARRNAAAHR